MHLQVVKIKLWTNHEPRGSKWVIDSMHLNIQNCFSIFSQSPFCQKAVTCVEASSSVGLVWSLHDPRELGWAKIVNQCIDIFFLNLHKNYSDRKTLHCVEAFTGSVDSNLCKSWPHGVSVGVNPNFIHFIFYQDSFRNLFKLDQGYLSWNKATCKVFNNLLRYSVSNGKPYS